MWIHQSSRAADVAPAPFGAEDINTCLECFADASCTTELKREAVRLLQIGLGDLRTKPGRAEVYTGYVGNHAEELDGALRMSSFAKWRQHFPPPIPS